MAKQERGQETKQRISQVALELFKKKGFNKVTVDEIIQNAESSKGAFYNHFTSKHDIFAEKFREIDYFYVEKLFPELESEDDLETKLKSFLTMQMEYIEEDLGWDVVRTIYEQELNTERESFFQNPERPLYHFLHKLFDEGRRQEIFREDLTTEQMVEVLIRAMRGILYDWAMRKGSYKLAVEQKPLFEVVIRGLRQ
ncbi:TetR/AcrR family transcriptional regulator [Planococcus plakortidis]|uniref:TetR/AcrR family transcriptional regulator n=1 Tax=Planococcus plakortidis TaxID=1038856 RepID=UPI0038581B1A